MRPNKFLLIGTESTKARSHYGTATSDKLYLGKHSVSETAAAEGYALDSTIRSRHGVYTFKESIAPAGIHAHFRLGYR